VLICSQKAPSAIWKELRPSAGGDFRKPGTLWNAFPPAANLNDEVFIQTWSDAEPQRA